MADSHQAGLLVAVLGEISTPDQSVLSRMRHGASNALAVALDVDRWARDGSARSAGTAPAPCALLTANGWVAVTAGPERHPAVGVGAARPDRRAGAPSRRRRGVGCS